MANNIRPQGYWRANETAQEITVIDCVEGIGYTNASSFIATLPEIGDAFPEEPYTDAVLIERSPARRDDTNIFRCELKYSTSQTNGNEAQPEDTTTYWSVVNNGKDLSLIEASNAHGQPSTYRYEWDNYLSTIANTNSSAYT